MLESFETDRLILRERTLNDLEYCLDMDRDDEVVKFIPVIKELVDGPLASKEKHIQFIKDRMEAKYPKGMGYWTIETKSNEFVGWIMLIPIDGVGPEIEMGWRLNRKSWGKGYATEAAKVILQYALEHLDLQEIVADINKHNRGSIRVAEKLGFTNEGTYANNSETDVRYSISQ